MMRLQRLSHSMISNRQLHYFALQISDIIRILSESDPHIKRQYDALQESIGRVEKILAHSRVNEKTEEYAKADKRMDSVLIGIRDFLQGTVGLRIFDTGKADAADAILSKMDELGPDLIHGGYEKQLPLVRTFINTMSVEPFPTHFTTVGMSHLIEGLKLSFNEVNTLSKEKREAAVKPESTITDENKILGYRIDGLLSYIDRNIYDSVDGFPAMETDLNELITTVMGTYRAKQTRKENAEIEEQAAIDEDTEIEEQAE